MSRVLTYVVCGGIYNKVKASYNLPKCIYCMFSLEAVEVREGLLGVIPHFSLRRAKINLL